jgi:enhancing lycopene biosynthesis protein 2
MSKIGVLLSGCGVYDGTEIHEAVLTLLALDRAGAEIICMAPNIDQYHVVNHITQEVMKEKRIRLQPRPSKRWGVSIRPAQSI